MRYRIAVALAVVFAAGPTFAHHFSQPPSTATYNSLLVVKTGTLNTLIEIQTDAPNLSQLASPVNNN